MFVLFGVVISNPIILSLLSKSAIIPSYIFFDLGVAILD
jgi:hypothetical protein